MFVDPPSFGGNMAIYKYEITVVESERGWGRDSWTEEFDTPEKAQERIDEINGRNKPGPAPDYYMQAYAEIRAVRKEA
ncbi:hypothetical protein SEA_GILSON_209 [Streptomyces phage Gilson]|uniref:Uncharacterized protein n=2 Tax=Gilsonvirus gilson TaxID=2846398 RepID=A0A3Q9R502_9CAUD|nr:hypothetical protein HWB98_gp075 [Streptomyces phage Gilson]AZU97254.1 hypothetical protein SEA_GILSON_209 [Streptomyces phage Gilson]